MVKRERKLRYKMYKAKKQWVMVPLVFLGIAMGTGLSENLAFADTADQAMATSQLEATTTKKDTEVQTKDSQEQVDVSTTQETSTTKDSMATLEAFKEVEKTSESSNQDEQNVTTDSTMTDQALEIESTTLAQSTSKSSQQVTTEASQNSTTPETKLEPQEEQSNVSKNTAVFETPQNYVEKKEDGYWYLYDTQTNEKYTGFQKLKDGRVVYYDRSGQMQYGWQWIDNATRYFDTFNGKMALGQQKINGHWYLFDQTGAMQRDFQYIPEQNKTVYYNQDGWMLYGQQNLNGHWYNFDTYTGAMKNGFVNISDQNKTVYYNDQGQMQYGWQWIENATRYFDTFTGKMAVGQQKLNDHWYLFDQNGVMQRGFQYIPDQNKTVYYNKQGQMQYGWQWIENATRYFDTFTGKMAIGQQKLNDHWYLFDQNGVMQRGFQYIPDQNKTVYYNEQGQMQYGWQWIENGTRYFDTFTGKMAIGQQKLNDHWYLFDQNGVMQRGFQYIPAQNKTVYYNQDGWMLYGSQQIGQSKYYFDPIIGALKTNSVGFDKQTKTLSYYASDGKQAVGNIVLDGKTYDFTAGILKVLGQQFVMIKNQTYLLNNTQVITGQQRLNGSWYYFDVETGVMARGFQYLADQNKTVYYNDQGQMQYGQQKIADHWYLFDKITGAIKIGLQYISEQNKHVYYANNGQMQYGTVRAGKITYYANTVTGAITGVFNDAEVIGQNPELPTGCEITAVTMMLRYAGKNVNKIQLAHEMPRSNNGDYGFVGDPFSVTGWWVFPTGVAPVVNNHLGTSKVMTGASWSEIYQQLLKGHLVVAWVANMNGFINHAITLTGYNNGIVYYNNPWTARKEQLSLNQFYTHWNADKQRALSY